ncbi:MAG: CapA family protein [Prevotella sp.]|nr:CapA family protein [Prevotella sp.]
MQAAAQEKTLIPKTLPPAPPCMEGSNMPLSADTAERLSTPLHAGRGRGEGLLLGRVHLLASNRLPLESFAYLPDRESVSQEPFDSLVNRVKAIKMADSIAVVIVNLHWGAEHTLRPLPQQRLEAHALIDAGADVIIGHHTHTLQSTETYRGKPIFYGIGNFIFDQQRPLNTEACIVRLRITTEKTMADAIPVRIDHCAPRLGR